MGKVWIESWTNYVRNIAIGCDASMFVHPEEFGFYPPDEIHWLPSFVASHGSSKANIKNYALANYNQPVGSQIEVVN